MDSAIIKSKDFEIELPIVEGTENEKEGLSSVRAPDLQFGTSRIKNLTMIDDENIEQTENETITVELFIPGRRPGFKWQNPNQELGPDSRLSPDTKVTAVEQLRQKDEASERQNDSANTSNYPY